MSDVYHNSKKKDRQINQLIAQLSPLIKNASDATVTAVTKSVNGGTIGLDDRMKHFKEYYSLLS